MKNKRSKLASKCLASLLALLMMISCFSAEIFATTAENGEEHAHQHQTVTSFSDGVYTVTIDADALFEMIDNGSITREGITNLIPEEMRAALKNGDGVSDRLVALLNAYIELATEGGTKKLSELLPVDMTIEYLTQEPNPLLWEVFSKEKLFESLDLSAILYELNTLGKLGEVININSAADIAFRDGLVNETMITTMINDLKTNDPTAYNQLVDEVVDIVLNNSEFDYISNAVAEKVLEDTAATQKLANLVMNGNTLVNLLSGNSTAISKLTTLIQSKNAMPQLIANGSINVNGVGALVTDTVLTQLLNEEAIDIDGLVDLLGSEKFTNIIAPDGSVDTAALKALIEAEGGATMLLENDLLKVDKVIPLIGGFPVLMEKNLVNVSDVITVVGGASVILSNKIVNIHDVVAAVGGATVLLEKEIVTMQMFMDNASSLRAIVLKINTPKIVELFGFTRILNTIGADNLVANPDIAALVDYTALFKIFVENDMMDTIKDGMMKALNKEALIQVASAYIINFSKSISINGQEIYSAYDSKIDVNRLTQILAEAIPTFDTLANDPVNAFALVIDWELNEKNIDPATTKSHYNFGIALKFKGDTDRLAKLCEKLAGYVSVVNEGEKTDVVINVPAKFAAVYLQAVNADRLPSELKTKLLTYMDAEITDDSIGAMIADFTAEELATIIECIDFTAEPEVVEKLLNLVSDPHTRLLSLAKRTVNAMTYDKLLSVAQRLGIDQIESGLENNEEKIRNLRNKILERIDEIDAAALDEALKDGLLGDYTTLLAVYVRANADLLNLTRDYLIRAINKAFEYAPAQIVGTKLSDHYQGNGQFGPIEALFSYDISTVLDRVLSKLPDSAEQYAKNFLKNTEITRDVSVQVTFRDIFEAEFVNPDGDVAFVTYLPVGAELSEVFGVPALQTYGSEWTYDGEELASFMPAKDIRLIVFEPDHVHDYVFIETVDPTCTEDGYDLYRCSCHLEERRNVLPALGHDFSDRWTITIEPTKYRTGKAVLKCSRDDCGIVCEEYTLPVLPDETDWFYLVTKNFEGYCDEWTITYAFLLGTDPVPYEIVKNANAAHDWSEWVAVENPTIFEEGTEQRTCNICGKVQTQSSASLDSASQNLVASNGVIISGIFADGFNFTAIAKDVDYNADVWASADGIGNVDRIKLMDISVGGLASGLYDNTIGLTVTIPIAPQHRDRDLVVYHRLHDGTFEKFANNDPVDEAHRLTVVDITTMTGTTPAIRFTVYSFSEFLVGMIHEHEFGDWQYHTDPTLTVGGSLIRYCTTGNELHEETLALPHLNEAEYDYVITSAADCENSGMGTYTYTTSNGQTFTFDVILDALGHSWGPWTEVSAPTATTKGQLKRECSAGCVETVTLYELVATNKDKYTTYRVITPALCESDGLDEYIYVIDGRTFPYTVNTPALGHSWNAWQRALDPTATTKGRLERTCSHDQCNELETVVLYELVPANEDKYASYSVITPAKCETGGQDKYVFEIDGQGFEFLVDTAPLGHAFGAWDAGPKPTLTTSGLLTRVCANDATHTETHILPVLNKVQYTFTQDPPTCTEKGYDYYAYTLAGQTFTFSVEIPATDHSYGPWEVTTKPTLTTTGLLTKVCANDATHTETHILPELNKVQYTFTQDPPTCTEKGYDYYAYTLDGQTFTFSVEIPATDHSYGLWEETTAPTLTTPGLLTRVCTNDATHTETHTLPVLSKTDYTHTPISGATCTTPGSEKYAYTLDGQTFEFTVNIPATDHSYSAWTVTLAPTKDSTGTLTRVCANNAEHKETFTLPKLDNLLYQYTLVSGATCTTPGSEKYVYTKDGQPFEFTVEIPATNHTFGEWTVVTAPTLQATGTLERVCATDPTHKETHTLPALNKTDYTYTVTAPLCEVKGMEKYSYTKDGQTFDFTIDLDPIGHKFADWTVRVKPTMTTGGELVRICTNDPMHEETHKLPAFNEAGAYTYQVVKEPTATEDGSAVYTYTFDGKTFEFTVVLPATGASEPDGGFPWWIILVIVLALTVIGLIIYFFFIKRNNDNDKKPPEAPAAPVAPAVEEKEEKVAEEVKETFTPAPAVIVPKTVKRDGKKSTVNLDEINASFADGETVSLETLKEKGLLSKSIKRYKVLANGNVDKALTVEADEFTAQAKEKILAAGGNVITVRIQR